MSFLLRSLFRKSSPAAAGLEEDSPAAAAPATETASTNLRVQNLNMVNATVASAVERLTTSTWEEFWAVRNLANGRVDENRGAIEALLSAQIEWLFGALSLFQRHDGQSNSVDVGVEVRQELSSGSINEGTINAAVAKVLGAHFWPRVEGPEADAIRTAYRKHSISRPTPRFLTGDTRAVPAVPTAGPPRVPRTVATKLAAEVLDELVRRHDLADEDFAERTAEVQKRMYEQQAQGTDPAGAASIVLDDLDRYVQLQQSKYRVNAKRGVKTENMIWRSRGVVEICGCRGCISARTQQTPWVTVEKPLSPEIELRRELAARIQALVPRKYLEVLRLDLVVDHDLMCDASAYTCHKERIRRMTSLIVSLFDSTSGSPETSYLKGLHELLTLSPSHGRELLPTPRQIRTWQDAEENAAEWMRHMGHVDARVTNGGADGGIDVVSHHAVAQVKREATAIGSPMIQKFYGAAHARGVFNYKLFFSGSGYSKAAREDAQRLGIALSNYLLDGRIEPANASAETMLYPVEENNTTRAATALGDDVKELS